MFASLHSGTLPTASEQPNGTLVSMPITTASRPELMTRRAWKGSVTMRYHPLPGPPYCASTYASNSRIRCACSRIERMSSQRVCGQFGPSTG